MRIVVVFGHVQASSQIGQSVTSKSKEGVGTETVTDLLDGLLFFLLLDEAGTGVDFRFTVTFVLGALLLLSNNNQHQNHKKLKHKSNFTFN